MKWITGILATCLLFACHAPDQSPRPDNRSARAQSAQGNAFLEQGIHAYAQQNYNEAMTVFTQASAAGEIKAPRYIGLMYLNGYGVEKNPRRAVAEFAKAAAHSDAVAQFWLGYCYEQGIGVPQDTKHALHWYRLSAQYRDGRSAPAMNALGRLAEAENPAEAVRWYRQSAALGSQEAKAALDRLEQGS